MIRYFIPLLASWLPLWHAYLIPFLALAFIAWVGAFIHSLFRR